MLFRVTVKPLKYTSIAAVCLMLAVACRLFAVVEETASLRDFLYGSTEDTAYDNFYSRVVEGMASEGYNQHAPWDRQTNGFGYFRTASETDRIRWGEVVSHFLQLDFEEAEILIEEYQFPYEVVIFNDTDTDRTYYMLRETLNMEYFDDNNMPDNPELHQEGSFDYGWGLYIYNPESDKPIVITTPHPKDDFISVPISCLAFQMWDARYLMISGAGREARWTRQGAYTNNKSLSDPSREENHVFNVFYKAACSDIRTTFGRRELSPQIHSFDHTHMGYNSLQISAGNNAQNYPGLPIRDVSGNYLDIVNTAPYIIFPENTIGDHEAILVTDYYSVHYNTHGFNFNNDGELIEISNNINLPGAGANRQVAHTVHGWNRFDVVSPFFHIEMEELPSCYEQDMATYRWFYGYDEETETWDTENFFTRAIQFYTPWLEHFAEILPTVLELNDDLPPTDPSNLRVTEVAYNRIGLSWNRSFAYDFFTYEILHARTPINMEQPNYSIINRNRTATLAGQAYTSANVTILQPGLNYHLRIRARDYHNNYSEVSNEVVVATIPANIAYVRAYGRDSLVDVEWFVQNQRNNQGFKVWRNDIAEELIELVGSFETDTLLVGVNADTLLYTFVDSTAVNGVLYEYMISSVGFSEVEHLHRIEAPASPEPIYAVHFNNPDGSIRDSVEFGRNRYAYDGVDFRYDYHKRKPPDPDEEEDYIFAMFYYPVDWSLPRTLLQRDIHNYFDTEETYKFWRIGVRSNINDEPLTISISDNYYRYGEKLYIKCHLTGEMFNMADGAFEIDLQNENYRYFTLYWGNLLPEVAIAHQETRYLQAGEEISIDWQTNFPVLVESFDVYLDNNTDSLAIALNIGNNATGLTIACPDSLYLYNARLIVRANMENDRYVLYQSPFRLGIIPSYYDIDAESGWHLISTPFAVTDNSLREIFGEASIIESPVIQDDDYLNRFDFGRAYWVFTDEEVEYRLTGSVFNGSYEIKLNRGWNLIPNVYYEDININNLNILRRSGVEATKQTWSQAVGDSRIDGGVIGFRDNCYYVTDTIPAGGAVWVYTTREDLAVLYEPFVNNQPVDEPLLYWQVNLIAAQSDYHRDEIVIGAPQGIKVLKPPVKPGAKFKFYIYEQEERVRELHSFTKSDLVKGLKESRYWMFFLELDSLLEPVIFSCTQHLLPENFALSLIINEEEFFLTTGEDFIYHPLTTTIRGYIRITNEETTHTEDLIFPTTLFGNYPNPFGAGTPGTRSGGTTISFWLQQQGSVKLDVYNIKGQKVITLIDDELETGKYEISWSGQNAAGKPVASGIYFYGLNVTGKEIARKKMLLIK